MQKLASSIWGIRILVPFFGLFVLDWMFTIYFLELGATEANPLVALFIYDHPFYALLLKMVVGSIGVLVFFYEWYRTWVRVVVVGVTVLYTFLIAYELLLYLIS